MKGKKRRAQNHRTGRTREFAESRRRFVREFARATAIDAREMWQGTYLAEADNFALKALDELEELAKALEPPRPGDDRGRFMSPNAR